MIDSSVVLLAIVVGYAAWEITFSDVGIFLTRRESMRRQRKKNAKRGITMRPGFVYRLPHGVTEMSPTGREEDIIRQTPAPPEGEKL